MRQRELRQLMAMVVHLTPSLSAYFRLNYGLPLGSRPILSDRPMAGLAELKSVQSALLLGFSIVCTEFLSY